MVELLSIVFGILLNAVLFVLALIISWFVLKLIKLTESVHGFIDSESGDLQSKNQKLKKKYPESEDNTKW